MKDLLVNIGHTAAAKVLLVLVQFVTVTILARNLSADDYGVVGFANIMLALLTRISGMGLTQAIIRHPLLEDRVLGTAATLNILLSVGSFACAQLLAPVVGSLLNNPASVSVVRVSSIGFLLVPLGFLPTCMLNREMRFARLRAPSVFGAIVRGIVSVSLALTGWKYWSLVLGTLAERITTYGSLQLIRSVRFQWQLDKAEARDLLRFGLPLTLAGLVTFGLLNADNFFVGSILGSKMLGYYTVAFTWATFFSNTLQEVVHSVLFPKFSKMQTDRQNMRVSYLRTLRIVSFAAVLVNISLLIVAESFLVHVLGKGTDRWLPACDALRILCIYGIFRTTIETVGNPIMALGDSKLFFRANGVAVILELILLPFVARWYGIEGVACLATLAYLSQVFFYVPFLKRELLVMGKDLTAILVPVYLAGILGLALVYLLPVDRSLASLQNFILVLPFSMAYLLIHEVLSKKGILSEISLIWKSMRKDPAV